MKKGNFIVVLIMGLILDDISEIGEHVRNNFFYLIRSRTVICQIISAKRAISFNACATFSGLPSNIRWP